MKHSFSRVFLGTRGAVVRREVGGLCGVSAGGLAQGNDTPEKHIKNTPPLPQYMKV